jgi:hypothetical protein
MTLDEVYSQKIELANKIQGIIQFTFEFERRLHLVKWDKHKWSDPIKIEKL